jgi:hypothetical protein
VNVGFFGLPQQKVNFLTQDKVFQNLARIVGSTITVVSPEMSKKELAEYGKGGEIQYNIFAPQPDHINFVVRPFGVQVPYKKEPLHKGTGFTLESDGPYGPDQHTDIEFVTEPFDESDSGLQQLEAVLQGMSTIVSRLGPKAGRSYAKGDFVGPSEHGLSNQKVYLSGGSAEPDFKMQATSGHDLANLPRLMEYFGTVANESAQEKSERDPARRFESGKDAGSQGPEMEVMGRSPGMAKNVVSGIKFRNPRTASLEGFTALLLMYLQRLHTMPNWFGLKTLMPLMSRRSFASLAAELPGSQVAQLSETPTLKQYLLAIEREIQIYQPTFSATGPVIGGVAQNEFAQNLQTLKVAQWVAGIFKLNIDYLSASGFLTFISSRPEAKSHLKYQKSTRIFMRGLGDAKTVQGDPTLAVVENRAINPAGQTLDMETAAAMARQYLAFMRQIRRSGGHPGRVGPFPS